MDDGAFQWDDQKAATNYARHNVAFEAAREVFNDPLPSIGLTMDRTRASSVSRRLAWLKAAYCLLHMR
jgi:uncharacterized DUF497 family protein